MKKLIFFISLCYLTFAQAEISRVEPLTATTCIACHGQEGVSINPEWPSLAGQHARYLFKQLNEIKQGHTRNVPVMVGVLAHLTENDLKILATFYSSLPIPASGKTPIKYLKEGERLYRGGDIDKHISACIACHGPQGTGNAQAGFPVLSGQNALYTLQQLQAFKNKKRTNDLNGIMQDISARMSDEEMMAVAYYIQGLY